MAKNVIRRGTRYTLLSPMTSRGTANEFMKFCRLNSINSSGAIRLAITEWLDSKMMRDKKLSQLENGTHFMHAFAEDYEKKVLREA